MDLAAERIFRLRGARVNYSIFLQYILRAIADVGVYKEKDYFRANTCN